MIVYKYMNGAIGHMVIAADNVEKPEEQESTYELPKLKKDCDFVVLDRGCVFVRKWMIEGLKWQEYKINDESWDWRLEVAIEGCDKIYLHGREASHCLKQLGLPPKPPKILK